MSNNEKSKAELIEEILLLQKELSDLKDSLQLPNTPKSKKALSAKEIDRIHNTLYNISLQGIIVQDQTDKVIDANPAAQTLLGLTLDQLQGRTSFDERWRAIREDGSPYPGEEHPSIRSLRTGETIKNVIMGVYNPLKDKLCWFNICSIPVFKPNEVLPYLVFTIFDDVTELKQVENLLVESEEKFKNAFQNSPVGMAICGLDDKFLMVNSKLCEILGYSDKELIQFTSKDISYGDDYNLHYDKIKKVKDGILNTSIVEKRYVNKNGNIIWVKVSLSMVRDFKGIPLYLIKQIDDITEKKKINEQLINEKNRLSFIISGTNVGTWEWDIKNNTKIYNERLAEIIGYNLTEILPMTINEIDSLIHPEDIKKSDLELQKHFKGLTEFYECEYRIKHKYGDWVWVLDKGKVFERDENNNPLKMYGTHQDITASKKFEYELYLAKQKAENSDRLKTSFLQNISHEIRTPLNGIIGFADLLQFDDITLEEVTEYSAIIKRSSNRLLEIVNNVLDISRIETGQVELKRNTISVNKILSEIYKFFNTQTQNKGIELVVSLLENDIIIFSDDTKINQILVNLVNNAIKFTDKGKIEIGTYLLGNNIIEIYVKDTGIGIPNDKLNEVFQRFTQIEIETDKNYQGAGLGLAICKGMAELLGGDIKLTSSIGIGSTFSLIIPYRISDEQINKYNNENKNTFYVKKYNILVVDDDEINILLIDKFLTSLRKNINILTASNGKDAIFLVENKRIDLVLMDINMPIIDGLETSKIIKGYKPNLPIVIQTAYIFDEEKEKSIRENCDYYISKPIEKNIIANVLDRFLK